MEFIVCDTKRISVCKEILKSFIRQAFEETISCQGLWALEEIKCEAWSTKFVIFYGYCTLNFKWAKNSLEWISRKETNLTVLLSEFFVKLLQWREGFHETFFGKAFEAKLSRFLFQWEIESRINLNCCK